MKTARFADVVEKSGAPETYLLWVPAAEDKAFQRALKEHRILTVHQEIRGAKKDFGVVGFHEEPNAQFLIFPTSVRSFEGRRVIGINYDLLAEPKVSKAAAKPAPPPKKPVSAALKTAPPLKKANEVKAVIDFTPPPRAEPTPTPAPRVEPIAEPEPTRPSQRAPAPKNDATTAIPASVLKELDKVLKDLRAGKSVVAYQRLEKVVTAAKGGA